MTLSLVKDAIIPLRRLWTVDVIIKLPDAEAASTKHYGVHALNKREALAQVATNMTPLDAQHLIGINCITENIDLTGDSNDSTE